MHLQRARALRTYIIYHNFFLPSPIVVPASHPTFLTLQLEFTQMTISTFPFTVNLHLQVQLFNKVHRMYTAPLVAAWGPLPSKGVEHSTNTDRPPWNSRFP